MKRLILCVMLMMIPAMAYADIEEFKHAYHILVFDGDAEPIQKLGLNLKLSSNPDVFKRYLQYSRQIKKIFDGTNKHEHELLVYAMSEMRKIPGLHLIGTATNKASVLSFSADC